MLVDYQESSSKRNKDVKDKVEYFRHPHKLWSPQELLAGEVWTVLKYILHPVHVSDLQRRDWAEQRNNVLESAVDVYKRNKALPVS